jgi:hypothetical protein
MFQFHGVPGARLDNKDAFVIMCSELGLRVPRTELSHSARNVLAFDFGAPDTCGNRSLLKFVGVDDRTQNDMTLFLMRGRLEDLHISEENLYILQESLESSTRGESPLPTLLFVLIRAPR